MENQPKIKVIVSTNSLKIHISIPPGKHIHFLKSSDTKPTVISWGFTAVAIIISRQGAVLLPTLPAETACVFDVSGGLGSSPEALGSADCFLILTHQFILAVRWWALQVVIRVDLLCFGVEKDGLVTVGKMQKVTFWATRLIHWLKRGRLAASICMHVAFHSS